jgi:hypothetical protein
MCPKKKKKKSYLCRKRPELWPKEWILHHDNAPAHKALTVKQFLAQKAITDMEHPAYFPDLALNDFWLYQQQQQKSLPSR